ncbi:DUF6153 family protein [Streptomyces sp. NPDC047046]|uniref:DUF6153 family protein n=1 Tax=Streptomyces sp. NPDC047046 TaxID=3155378 RepID=UPI0033C1C605
MARVSRPLRRALHGPPVLLLAVLLGLLAMHGLPGTVPRPETGWPDRSATAGHHACAQGAHRSPAACPEDSRGHLAHADATCAAAGTAGTYTPPAPGSAPLLAAPHAGGPAGAVTSEGARRAPPELSRLQVLRI